MHAASAYPPPLELRPVTAENVSILKRVNASVLPVCYGREYYDEVLRQQSRTSRLAYWGGAAVGAIACRIEDVVPRAKNVSGVSVGGNGRRRLIGARDGGGCRKVTPGQRQPTIKDFFGGGGGNGSGGGRKKRPLPLDKNDLGGGLSDISRSVKDSSDTDGAKARNYIAEGGGAGELATAQGGESRRELSAGAEAEAASARDHKRLYIMTLCVLPTYRDRGIGSALLREVLGEAASDVAGIDEISLHVHTANVGAIRFYTGADRGFGFVVEETIRGYYKGRGGKVNPPDCHVLTKRIRPGRIERCNSGTLNDLDA
mmetsp:Transcript_32729/g.64852  ORF Transcript_32729/g.64852 Transcript_32729/m.64852 type:complete len:315 (+) Transcript_32729:130-1074(+)|eukprot:CAMPEP_0194343952 /NCGR_PEP_ID=MMETSP0171-20130528/99349_1 /TAXON_ID=218684 /ORGANISM="Corethron pennatum, Strain L29A3" /LENGTH=314 /DNA_ID=CAMNT_0039110417 /DNA_START=44 /DNA_END=988 /DNA_ORIENTATION=-